MIVPSIVQLNINSTLRLWDCIVNILSTVTLQRVHNTFDNCDSRLWAVCFAHTQTSKGFCNLATFVTHISYLYSTIMLPFFDICDMNMSVLFAVLLCSRVLRASKPVTDSSTGCAKKMGSSPKSSKGNEKIVQIPTTMWQQFSTRFWRLGMLMTYTMQTKLLCTTSSSQGQLSLSAKTLLVEVRWTKPGLPFSWS